MSGDHDPLLTPRWYPLKPHPEQIRLITSPARFKVVPAGRRSGKSERAKRNLIIQALNESAQGRWGDYRYFAAAPTRDQAKAIFWNDLKALVPKGLLGSRIRESDLTIQLVTGAEIVVVGLDRPQRIEGRSWNGGVIDEIANVRPGAWGENIRPALSDRQGWCWLIGVPEGRGSYYEMYKHAISGEDPEWAGFHWVSADILPPDEIESARRTLDPLVFQQEMEASFVTFSGRVYHAFDARTHCEKLEYDPTLPLILTFDFNSTPGSACIIQEQLLPNGQSGTAVLADIHIPRHSTTPAICRKIAEQWGHHKGAVVCYGDATGGAQGSARVQGSDWQLIRNELAPVFGRNLAFRVPAANPRERVRVNAVNSRLKSADGTIRLMVDPRHAPNVVRDFEGVRILEGGSGEIDKKADPLLSHWCFAAGTLVDLDTGPCKIEDVPLSGRVRTWDGSFVEYTDAGKTMEDTEIVSVSINDGSMIYCTPDHQWLTSRGWQCAVNLEGLELKSWRSRLSHLPSRISTGRHITSMERSLTSRPRTTARNTEPTHTFIEPCGSIITALFRKVIIFTTGTTTDPTTRSRTLSFSPSRSTSTFTLRKIRKVGNRKPPTALNWLGRWLLNGTDLRKVRNGIVATLMRCAEGRMLEPSPVPASSAANSSWLPALVETPPCIAARTVRPETAITVASTMKTDPARDVAGHSGQTVMPEPPAVAAPVPGPLFVESVRQAGQSDVYCLRVPSAGCFALANGAIVSNSDSVGYYLNREFPIVSRAAGVSDLLIR